MTPAKTCGNCQKTCGNCQHFREAEYFPDCGHCHAPVPMIVHWLDDDWVDGKHDATACPCWKAKE